MYLVWPRLGLREAPPDWPPRSAMRLHRYQRRRDGAARGDLATCECSAGCRTALRAGERFQNYRALFTVLIAATVPRAWLDSLLHPAADPTAAHPSAPGRWHRPRCPDRLTRTVLRSRSRYPRSPRSTSPAHAVRAPRARSTAL